MLAFSPYISSFLDQIIVSIPYFKPELTLIVTFIGTILASLFIDKHWKHTSFTITLIGLLLSGCYLVGQGISQVEIAGFFDMIHIDAFAIAARLIILLSTILIAVFIQQRHQERPLGDLYAVLLTATLGLNLLTMSSNWLMIFIAVETVSISSYIMVGYFSTTKVQSEAALKYVLFGSICAAVMLYGLSLLYGFTGNLNFDAPSHIAGLMEAPQIMISIALLFLLTGIGFKLSFFPFHVWSPDVYQGAPTVITTYLATVPKIAVVVLLSKILSAWLNVSFYFSDFLTYVIIAIAIATMLIGNLAALRQQDAKRMMAYSSIGHTGILLMAVLVYQNNESNVLLFYLSIYALMNIAVFIFIDTLEASLGNTWIESYRGLGKQFPLLFTSFSIVLIALIGLPPTAGFVGKLLVFSKVFEQYQNFQSFSLLVLLIVGALTSVISLFYYFKIPLNAFLKDSTASPAVKFNAVLLCIGILCTVAVLILGIFPNLLLSAF
ncbi:MAG: NADH-quinone oxidoreductase subunit N [Sphingobacterium sp.]|jgi:NADH-quinone oxidoreductase subunit N|uniref:NADH-quinone oxidoreductase subunit N n=1 Tax=Sphingobacterium sp. TaxID=341027 RepID=UPI00283ACCF0|nr:NADH-quinone oxidoreductase subunit N [Sphingobacterium sp.]MDR3010249.1 NADH-quinone oxidoreductase subunit N [Sphingobacterium sp.]